MKQKVIERIGEGPNRKGRKSSGEEEGGNAQTKREEN